MPQPVREHQRQHIAAVMQVAGDGLGAPQAARHDEIICASWQRCVHEHRLDPTRMPEAIILPQARLREHQDQMEAFLQIARHGLVVEPSLRTAGLYLGADWSEHNAGTRGVGTRLSTGQALTVHLDDHFDATHIPLTCTAAPVFSPSGELSAMLDISALTSDQPQSSQHLALQLFRVHARHVENAQFLHRFRHDWVLRLSPAPQFLDVNPDDLLALDAGGQGGIAMGARLRRLGVPTTIVEKNPRTGDGWRKRYKSLRLHDPVWYDHLPYLPFPDNRPVFAPEDKTGDWLEAHTKRLELNDWGATVAQKCHRDEAAQRREVQVEREGKPVTLRPKELVIALGVSG